jgi:DNA-binding NtrC family response regulator
MELCAPVGQSAALDALLSDNDCDVIRDDRLGPRPSDLRDASLPQSIAEHRTSVVLFSIGADALAPHSRFWEILRHFRGRVPIVVAAHGIEPPQVRTLLACGVSDFVIPPFHAADVVPRIWRAGARQDDGEAGRDPTPSKPGLQFGLLGDSPAFVAMLTKLPAIASCDVTVLIVGETGTGKELIARAIHYLSRRKSRPFVPVDCAGIPAELAESELFGHERGAFTGAVTTTAGLAAAAREGTIFLDDVDALPVSVQPKLLRFLQQKEYRPLGSVAIRKADVRVISATNAELGGRVQSAQFREDLFYRLNVLQVRLPPLRERPGDIGLLARHFVAKYRAEFDRPAQTLSTSAQQKLLLHRWPGNVRELENVIQAAVALCHGPIISGSDLPLGSRAEERCLSFRQAKVEAVTEFERDYVERLLRANGGNISSAARAANKNRRAFWELMRKYRISPRQFRGDADAAPSVAHDNPGRQRIVAR